MIIVCMFKYTLCTTGILRMCTYIHKIADGVFTSSYVILLAVCMCTFDYILTVSVCTWGYLLHVRVRMCEIYECVCVRLLM